MRNPAMLPTAFRVFRRVVRIGRTPGDRYAASTRPGGYGQKLGTVRCGRLCNGKLVGDMVALNRTPSWAARACHGGRHDWGAYVAYVLAPGQPNGSAA